MRAGSTARTSSSCSAPSLHQQLQTDLELLEAAGHPFDHDQILTGDLVPVFFGSALTNFGVEPFFREFLELAPSPTSRLSTLGPVEPTQP